MTSEEKNPPPMRPDSPSKEHTTCLSTSDVISGLPSNIVEKILMCLPTRDVVRTSILSRNWRYRWANCPQLLFNDDFGSVLLKNDYKLWKTIYQILLGHSGPILKFTLSITGMDRCPEIDHLILFLSNKGIQEFTLQILQKRQHKMPSYLFSCLQLLHLNLRSCIFKPPPMFKGFSRLINLEFEKVNFYADIFASFISDCPLLERLVLMGCTEFQCLELDAPNLKFFRFRGLFKSICFKNTPLLAIVSIDSCEDTSTEPNNRETSNLISVFGCLPLIENLCADYYFVKFLAVGGNCIPSRLPVTLNHLKVLKLQGICLGEMFEVSCILCLIRSSPNLRKLVIKWFESPCAVEDPILQLMVRLLLNNELYSDDSFNQLKEVELQLFNGTKPGLAFIKLLLAKSSVLKTLLIQPSKGTTTEGAFKILKVVTRFPRASPKAEIRYLDPDDVDAVILTTF